MTIILESVIRMNHIIQLIVSISPVSRCTYAFDVCLISTRSLLCLFASAPTALMNIYGDRLHKKFVRVS